MIERNNDVLCVCYRCLLGIESHEGKQFSVAVLVDEDDPKESACDWCNETGFDTLYQI